MPQDMPPVGGYGPVQYKVSQTVSSFASLLPAGLGLFLGCLGGRGGGTRERCDAPGGMRERRDNSGFMRSNAPQDLATLRLYDLAATGIAPRCFVWRLKSDGKDVEWGYESRDGGGSP